MSYLALEATILAREPDLAEKHLTRLPKKYAEAVSLDLAFLRGSPGLFDELEKTAKEALATEGDGALAIELAHAVLPYRPALGILLARGALHEGRVRECERLLEKMEDARDRLLLAPAEPWWDFYEAMIEEAEDQRAERKRAAGEKELRAELRRARQAARKASTEIGKLQERQKEIEDTLANKPLPAKKKDEPEKEKKPVERPAELEEERKRLKQKIDELQRIIGEGQEERRELRKKLQDVVEEAKPDEDDDEGEEEEENEPDDAGGDGIDAPRNVLVPRFSDRATKAMGDLTRDVADGVLSTIAGLAAGRPNAWSYVKNLTKARGIFSARAGIHHRVLFATTERVLDVLEVIHRKDLEQAVDRIIVSR
jgi:chromosome segregation ATPase